MRRGSVRAGWLPVASLVDFLGFLRGFFGTRADPGVVEEWLELGACVPASPANAEEKLGWAAGVNADLAEALTVHCQRDAGCSAADQGHVETWVTCKSGDAFFQPAKHRKPVCERISGKSVRAFKRE